MLNGLIQFIEAGHSWYVECAGLFLIPFLHEDVAILAGSLMIVEHRLPMPLAVGSIFAGMVASDFLLYGLGVLARRSLWIRHLLLRPGTVRMGQWLGSHVGITVALARFIPGLIFPVYLGCGFYRISFARFAATTALTAAIYLPIVLYLIIRFGEAVLANLGYWSWLLLIAFLAIAAMNWIRHPHWQFLLRVSVAGARAFVSRVGGAFESAGQISHRGMPAIGRLKTRIALAERIPMLVFYVPLVVQWMGLSLRYGSISLPTLANPNVEFGGLWGESKSRCMDMIGEDQRQWLADYTTLHRGHGAAAREADAARVVKLAGDAGLTVPLVAKPDIGWRGFGVRLAVSEAELEDYVRAYPEDETIVLQRLIDFEGEAGVLYARLPGETVGTIISVTFRYFPHVTGDGQNSIRKLVLGDQRAGWKAGYHFGFESVHAGAAIGDLDRVPAEGETVRLSFIGSNRVGGLYRDAREHITPELTALFDRISQSMPDFYYGRFDLRFASVEGLRRGEDFKIIEINGAGGESINIWDPDMPISQAYRELFAQQSLLFKIGAMNRARGFRPSGGINLLLAQWKQHRLIRHYPPSS